MIKSAKKEISVNFDENKVFFLIILYFIFINFPLEKWFIFEKFN